MWSIYSHAYLLSPHRLWAAYIQNFQFSSDQSLSTVQIFVTPWTPECQASMSITNSQSLHKLMSIESVMPSNHLIFCPPLLLPPSIIHSIRVFSNESVLHIRWPKYWVSASASVLPINIQDWFHWPKPYIHWHKLITWRRNMSLWLTSTNHKSPLRAK